MIGGAVIQGTYIDGIYFASNLVKIWGGGMPTCPLSSNGPAFRCLQVSMEVGFFRNGHVNNVVFFLSSSVP